jgi:hypothetical protein
MRSPLGVVHTPRSSCSADEHDATGFKLGDALHDVSDPPSEHGVAGVGDLGNGGDAQHRLVGIEHSGIVVLIDEAKTEDVFVERSRPRQVLRRRESNHIARCQHVAPLQHSGSGPGLSVWRTSVGPAPVGVRSPTRTDVGRNAPYAFICARGGWGGRRAYRRVARAGVGMRFDRCGDSGLPGGAFGDPGCVVPVQTRPVGQRESGWLRSVVLP